MAVNATHSYVPSSALTIGDVFLVGARYYRITRIEPDHHENRIRFYAVDKDNWTYLFDRLPNDQVMAVLKRAQSLEWMLEQMGGMRICPSCEEERFLWSEWNDDDYICEYCRNAL